MSWLPAKSQTMCRWRWTEFAERVEEIAAQHALADLDDRDSLFVDADQQAPPVLGERRVSMVEIRPRVPSVLAAGRCLDARGLADSIAEAPDEIAERGERPRILHRQGGYSDRRPAGTEPRFFSSVLLPIRRRP